MTQEPKTGRRVRTAVGKLACKIELPGRKRDVRTDRLPNGHLCLFVFTNRRMHLSAFLTWCDHDAFSQGDGCLDSPSHLRSDPAVMGYMTAAVRELPNTQIWIRIMRSLRKSLSTVIVHHPFPLKSRAARVIQFYRQGRKFSSRNKKFTYGG